MKTITLKQMKKLKSIEGKAWYYMNVTLKKWNNESKKFMSLYNEWTAFATEIGVMTSDGENVRYTCENGKDFSHGYNFGDCLA